MRCTDRRERVSGDTSYTCSFASMPHGKNDPVEENLALPCLTSPHFCCTGCFTLAMALDVMESFLRRVDSRAFAAAFGRRGGGVNETFYQESI